MKRTSLIFALVASGPLWLISPTGAAVLIDEVFDAGYDRLTQNIAGGNMAFFDSRSGTIAFTAPGSLSFSNSLTAGSQQYFGYFTDPGANVGGEVQNGHALIGVGQTLTVSLTFNLLTVPANTSYGLRFGLFDNLSTRQTADLSSGGNSAAFAGNPGYAVFVPLSSQTGLSNQFSFRTHTNFNNNIFNAAADFGQNGTNTGGNYTPLASATNYTFNFSVSRIDESTTELSASILDGLTLLNSGSAIQTSGTNVPSFSWIAWRIPQENAGGGIDTFSSIRVEIVPEPSSWILGGLGALVAAFWYRRRGR